MTLRPPNLIFILADDMGYGDLSRFNHGASETPVLDALAGESVCLGQHYAASPVCNPSRACLFTGRYPHRTGSIDTYDHLGGERLSLRERTLADILKANGYATGLMGKWHNGTFGEAYHPNRRGFDEFFGFRGGWQFYYDSRVERNGTRVDTGGRYLTDVITDHALDFVRDHQHEPFFLHVAYNCPHFPLQAPEEDIAPFRNRGYTESVETLYGMMRNMDRNIGRLLDHLDTLGLRENTLVCFTSDNGPDFGGKGTLTRFNCGLNGHKGLAYEGGIKVPMLLRWPAGLEGGGRSVDAMVHMSDWMPTLLKFCGVDLPADNLPLDGRDIGAVLRGESAEGDGPRFWQFNRYWPQARINAAVRDGDWKLVFPRVGHSGRPEEGKLDYDLKRDPDMLSDILPTPSRDEITYEPARPPELYHLGRDPGERENLADRDPARVARMTRQLEDWFDDVEADRQQCPDAIFR